MAENELNYHIEEPIKMSYLAEVLIRHKNVIISTFLLVIFIVAVFTLTQERMYEATTSIIVEDNQANQALGLSTVESNDRQIMNQLEVLQSKDLIKHVAEKISSRLYVNGRDTLNIVKKASSNLHERGNSSVTLQDEIAAEFTKNMWINNKEGTNVIKFAYRNPSAQEAALLANIYAETYNERDLASSRANAAALRNFLEEQNKIKTQKLAKSDSALQAYMQNANITELDAETSNLTNRVATLESQLEANEIDYKNSNLMLKKYKEEVQRLAPNLTQKLVDVDDLYIEELQQVIAKKEAERDMLKINSSIEGVSPQYSTQIRKVNNSIDSLKAVLQQRSKSYVQSSLSNYSIIDPSSDNKNHISELSGEIQRLETKLSALELNKSILYDNLLKYESKLGSIPTQSVTLAKLHRERLFNEKLYLSIGEKYEEAVLAEKSSFGKVKILDKASVPLFPVSPDFKFNFLIGILAGLSLGIILAFVLHYLYNKIHTPKDLEQLGYKLISIIPKMKLEGGNHKLLPGSTNGNSNHQIITAKNPNSEIYESYLRLGINLSYNFSDKKINSLLITSPGPGAGKSATALNVSVTLANLGKSVLLVDTDLRRPVIHKYFNKPISPGLTDFLLNQKNIDEIIQHTLIKGLDIITCGGRLLNPSLILSTPKMKKFVSEETSGYDFIIYDAPPLNVVTDAIHLAKQVDEVIMVVRAEKTNVNELQHSTDLLKQVNIHISGVVLNDFDASKAPFSYGRYYGYYAYNDDEPKKKKLFRKKKKGIAA